MIADHQRWTATSLREVAEVFGVSYQTAREWSAAGMPQLEGGGWFVPDVIQWKNARPRERKAAAEASVANVDEQLKQEQHRKLKLANDLKEGLLVDRAAVIQEASEKFISIRLRLEAIPSEIEMSIPPEVRYEVKAEVDHKIRQALKELASGTIAETA